MAGDATRIARMTLLERLNAKTEKTATCWIWRGTPGPHGYGRLSVRGTEWLAHRLAYQITRGDLRSDLEIDHLCRNRACVNPDHLEQVDRQTNVRRSDNFAGVNARATRCPEGHEYTKANTYLRPDGKGRDCLTCRRQRARDRQRERRAQLRSGR